MEQGSAGLPFPRILVGICASLFERPPLRSGCTSHEYTKVLTLALHESLEHSLISTAYLLHDIRRLTKPVFRVLTASKRNNLLFPSGTSRFSRRNFLMTDRFPLGINAEL